MQYSDLPGSAAPSAMRFVAHPLILDLQFVQLLVRKMLDVNHVVMRLINGLDDLIELEVKSPGVAVLGVLDEKHDQKCDNCGACIDDQLPGVGVMKVRSGDEPHDNRKQSEKERPPGPDPGGSPGRKDMEPGSRIAVFRFSHAALHAKPGDVISLMSIKLNVQDSDEPLT